MKNTSIQGFTLVEMLTVLAIFAMVSSVVLFNYNKFTSETILTNMAYEVALSVREAQIYGVSVRRPGGDTEDFSKAYGIFFPEVAGGSPIYALFADDEEDGVCGDGTICGTGVSEHVSTYTLQRNVRIGEVRAKNGSACADSNGMSVTFRRPNPEPLFDGDRDVDAAEVTVVAPDGAQRYVVISNNGQIYVTNDSICD